MRKTSRKFSQSHMLCKVALVAIMLVFQTMLGIGAGVLNAQTVKGTVISGSDNEPLIGASVMVQGTKTGATVQLKGDDIAKLNTTNPLSAMQGQTPGVNIVSTSGQPGAAMKGLAFSKSMETKFTVHSLFAVPQW